MEPEILKTMISDIERLVAEVKALRQQNDKLAKENQTLKQHNGNLKHQTKSTNKTIQQIIDRLKTLEVS